MPMSPEEKALQSRAAVHSSWAKTKDPTARTQPARDAFLTRFERQVDPDRELPEEERERRARHALKAHMYRLSLESAKARRREARRS